VPGKKAEGGIVICVNSQSAIKEVDLESELIRPGDLPPGYSGAQVKPKAPAMFDDFPPPDYAVYQQLQKGGEQVGGVTVLQFRNPEERKTAFQQLVKCMGRDIIPVTSLGELCFYYWFRTDFSQLGIDLHNMSGGDVCFVRGSFLVHIRMTRCSLPEDYLTYAKRLDKRLIAAEG
jgi:hypothetical protein